MDTVSDELESIGEGEVDPNRLRRLLASLLGSARAAGSKAVVTGQWLADQVVDVAPRIPVRTKSQLEAEHPGLVGRALADELVRRASRQSAALGAAAGVVATASQLAPPAWLVLPAELVVETLAIAVIELKLVAELHEALDRPIPGAGNERTVALLKAWAERRGVNVVTLSTKGGLADALGRHARHELTRLVRRRLMLRVGRNVSTLAPFLAGAVAGAEVNRRATRALGEAIVRDLATARESPVV